ncbi:unnamed protein product, partial [Mesorhabditis spiculigera]
MLWAVHLFCIWAGVCTLEAPLVNTKFGQIRGLDFERSDGQWSELFLGIPFAKPPVGELRFEKPVMVDKWENVLDATKYGPSCPPHNKSVTFPPSSEDCLHLSIIRPKDLDEQRKLPVLVWVHGGGYSAGSAANYPYPGLANIYNAQRVIVVEIQYRLGFLGFFSDGDNLPGNFGLWDQLAALKFVQEVIEDFGGDKEKVTIWGLSAGGASVSQLALSPEADGLFRGQIAMSGGSLMNWAFGENVLNHSRALAKELGCPFNSGLKPCLKALPLEKFYEAVEPLGSTQYSLDLLKWHPRIDGDLYPESAEKLIEKMPKRPQIMGVALKESLFFVVLNLAKSIHKLEVDPREFKNFDRAELERRIKDLVANSEYYHDQKDAVFEKVFAEYTRGEEHKQPGFYLEMYSKLLSDLNFNVGLVREAQLRAENDLPTFVYLTEHFNKAIYPEGYEVTGATHVCELPYVFELFPLGKYAIQGNPVEEKVNQFFQQSFINFVKTGQPVNKISPWPSVTTENVADLPYVHITDSPRLQRGGYFARETEFWNRIARDYHFDAVTLTKTEKNGKSEL